VPDDFHFLLDAAGALIVFQETGASWASVIAFSSEERARQFIARSNLDVAEIAAISADDSESMAELIRNVKRGAVRNLLLDLDYATGECVAIEFEGDALGISREYQLSPGAHARKR
jgi:predicted transcriptional regulator